MNRSEEQWGMEEKGLMRGRLEKREKWGRGGKKKGESKKQLDG